jgi:hypothetical protein
MLLAGCSDVPNSINPVSWWHGLEGGAIAQDRPPPPNPHAPFPHIAAAPARPAGMPDWEWQALQATLASQGAAAHQYAAQNPIPTLPQSAATTTPAAAAKPAAQPSAAQPAAAATSPSRPANQAASAQSQADADAIRRLAAAQGPGGSPSGLPPQSTVNAATAATQAPAQATSGSSLTFGAPEGQQPGSTSPGPQNVPVYPNGQPETGGSTVTSKYKFFDPNNGLSVPGALGAVAQPDEAHPPPVPTSVPAPPSVAGFAIPTVPSTYAPPKALPQPAPYIPPPPLPDVPPVPIAFAPHSAVLTPPMKRALLPLVAGHAGARIAVTGYGDAASEALADQSAAMPLALERARAITVQLIAYGLPPADLVPSAQALGQGGLARLVD